MYSSVQRTLSLRAKRVAKRIEHPSRAENRWKRNWVRSERRSRVYEAVTVCGDREAGTD